MPLLQIVLQLMQYRPTAMLVSALDLCFPGSMYMLLFKCNEKRVYTPWLNALDAPAYTK